MFISLWKKEGTQDKEDKAEGKNKKDKKKEKEAPIKETSGESDEQIPSPLENEKGLEGVGGGVQGGEPADIMAIFQDGLGASKGDQGGVDSGKITELEIKIADVDKKVDKSDAYIKATRSDLDEMKKKLEEVDSNIQKLLTIYDEFTKKINPFSEESAQEGVQVIEELPMSLTKVVPVEDNGLQDLDSLIKQKNIEGEFLEYKVPAPPSSEQVEKMSFKEVTGSNEASDDMPQEPQGIDEEIPWASPEQTPQASPEKGGGRPLSTAAEKQKPQEKTHESALRNEEIPFEELGLREKPTENDDGGDKDEDADDEIYGDVLENLKLTLTLLIAEMKRKGIDTDIIESILEG